MLLFSKLLCLVSFLVAISDVLINLYVLDCSRYKKNIHNFDTNSQVET